MSAALAGHEAAQREFNTDIFPCGGYTLFAQAVENDLVGGEADQRFMLGFHEWYAGLCVLKIASVERVGQNPPHLVVVNFCASIAFRKFGFGVKKTFNLGLRLKSPSSKSLQSLLYDAR